jgi:hypothetical protein
MVTISVVASPPWAEPRGVEVLEEGAERLTQLPVVWDPVFLPADRVLVLAGAGVGLQVGAEPVGVGVGVHDRGPADPAAEALGPHTELLQRSLFFVLETFGFLRLGDLRGHDLQQVTAESAELGGPELTTQADHLGLCPCEQLRVKVVRQIIKNLDHHAGLIRRGKSVGHPGRHSSPAPVQRFGQAGIGAADREVGAGHRRPPRPVVASTCVAGGIVCDSNDPELQFREHRLRPRDLGDRGLLLGRGQEHRLGIAHRLQGILCRRDRTQDGVQCDGLRGHPDSQDGIDARVRWSGAGVSLN